ncbi:MAG: tryptophan synthase subunit alpha [Gammaproteobacteria bacterium]|nr:tryptophan synthase subunit alpha [Gammaproteobacteria bacterium]
MSRIAAKFDSLKQAQRKALVPFVTAGDPDPSITVKLMHTLVEAGASMLELGVPFSDPMADGPVIQRASERALEHNVSMTDVFGMVKAFRETNTDTPIILMGYLNPVEVMGYVEFAAAAAAAGVDGAIIVDMPPQEAGDLVKAMQANQIDPIFLMSPTSTDERIKLITSAASGFVYYVSLKGVTGAATLDVKAVEHKLEQIRKHTDLPIGVGFGISDADKALQMSKISDAVIVGSALVKQIEANSEDHEAILTAARELIGGMRQAMDV